MMALNPILVPGPEPRLNPEAIVAMMAQTAVALGVPMSERARSDADEPLEEIDNDPTPESDEADPDPDYWSLPDDESDDEPVDEPPYASAKMHTGLEPDVRLEWASAGCLRLRCASQEIQEWLEGRVDAFQAAFISELIRLVEQTLSERAERDLGGLQAALAASATKRVRLLNASQLSERLGLGANRLTLRTFVSEWMNANSVELPDGNVVPLAHWLSAGAPPDQEVNDAILQQCRQTWQPGQVIQLARIRDAILQSQDPTLRNWTGGIDNARSNNTVLQRIKRTLLAYARCLGAREPRQGASFESAVVQWADQLVGGGNEQQNAQGSKRGRHTRATIRRTSGTQR